MPDLPYGGGSQQGALAEGVLAFSDALFGLVKGQQKKAQEAAKIAYDAEIQRQLNAAQNAYDSAYLAWYNERQNDPDDAKYAEKYQVESQTWKKSAEELVKLPEAKLAFEKYIGSTQIKQRTDVYELARERAAADARQQTLIRRDLLVAGGRGDELREMAANPKATYGLTPTEISGLSDDARKADATYLYNFLDKNTENELDAVQALDRDYTDKEGNTISSAEYFGVEPDVIKETLSKFTTKYTSNLTANTAKKEADAKKLAFSLLDEIVKDPMVNVDYNKVVEAEKALDGTHYQSIATNERARQDKLRTELIEASKKAGMTANYSNFDVQMINFKFSAGKTPPWTPETIKAALDNKDDALKITEGEYNLLRTQYEEAMAYKTTGAGKSDPTAENKLWDLAIGEHVGWTDDDRIKAMFDTGYFGKEVDGSTFNSIMGNVGDVKNNPEWQSYLTELNNSAKAYLDMLAATGTKSEATLREAAFKSGVMYRSFLQYLRDNPNRPDLWQKQLDDLKSGKIKETVRENTIANLTPPGAKPVIVPGWWRNLSGITGMNITTEMELEGNRQIETAESVAGGTQNGFTNDVLRYTEWRKNLPAIQDQMRRVLPKEAKDAKVEMIGDDTYFKKGESYYSVRLEYVDGEAKRVVYKTTLGRDGKTWSPWAAVE